MAKKKSSVKSKTARKAAKKTTRKPAAKAIKRTSKKSAKRKPSKKSSRKTTRKATKRVKKDSASTQRNSSRERVYNLTKELPEHHYFVLANGKPVKHVAELASILDQIEDHVFHHHVTPDRNDFHNWVKDVFDDMELARKIAGVGEKKHLQLVIYRHLAGHE